MCPRCRGQQVDRLEVRQTDRQTVGWVDRLMDKQTDGQTDGQTGMWSIDRLTDW